MTDHGNLSIAEWLTFVRRCPREFSIQYPPRAEFFMQNFSTAPPAEAAGKDGDPPLLYVHVPFCVTKCAYCFFATDQRVDPALMESYVLAVLEEIDKTSRVDSGSIQCLDVGGGTPTVLPATLLAKLLSHLSKIGACDPVGARSIETTPLQLVEHPDKVLIIRDNGFQRVSMGVQTTSRSALAGANRKQSLDSVLRAVELIRAAGIPRLNMDMIFGLQHQTLADWCEDLRRVIGLRPDSITVYDCIYRGRGRRLVKQLEAVPPLAVMGKMYDLAFKLLREHGYHGDYGSVNFSLHPGETGTSRYFERRLLWGEDYVGIGNYATSLIGDRWMFNRRDVDSYIRSVLTGTQPIENYYSLPPPERYAKYLLYSLNFGILIPKRFEELYGCTLFSVFGPELEFAQKAGWIEVGKERVSVVAGQFVNVYLLRSLLYSKAARLWFTEWIEEGELQHELCSTGVHSR